MGNNFAVIIIDTAVVYMFFFCIVTVICIAYPEIAEATTRHHSSSFNFPYQPWFRPQLQLFPIHLSKGDCVYFKGEGGKLVDLSEAMSCIRLLAAFMRISSMMLLAGDCELLIVTIYPQQSSVKTKKSLNENSKL